MFDSDVNILINENILINICGLLLERESTAGGH